MLDDKAHEELYGKAGELLLANALPEGNPKGLTAGKGYPDIWGRDGLISALPMSSSGEDELVNLAGCTIDVLARFQTELGQIPNKIRPDLSEVSYGKGGCVDASLLYPIAVWNHCKNTGDDKFLSKHADGTFEAFRWSNSLDQNRDCLIEANPGSDWFDLYRRSGAILYNQVLNYAAIEFLAKISEETGRGREEREKLLNRAENVRKNIQRFLWPREKYTDGIIKEYGYSWIDDNFRAALEEKNKQEPGEEYFLHFVDFNNADGRFDTFANSLAILFGIADEEQTSSIVGYMKNNSILKPYPARTLNPPITPDDSKYKDAFPDPELKHSTNPELERRRVKAGNYHNGGYWPYVGGFSVLALEKAGEDVKNSLDDLGELNSLFDYGFIEWHNPYGEEGDRGYVGQSWSAACYMLAHQKIVGKKETIFDLL